MPFQLDLCTACCAERISGMIHQAMFTENYAAQMRSADSVGYRISCPLVGLTGIRLQGMPILLSRACSGSAAYQLSKHQLTHAETDDAMHTTHYKHNCLK